MLEFKSRGISGLPVKGKFKKYSSAYLKSSGMRQQQAGIAH